MQGMHKQRSHFINKLTVALIAWAAMVTCREADLDVDGFHWYWVFCCKG